MTERDHAYRVLSGPPIETEADHVLRCPTCGTWIDCRPLSELLDHEEWCRRRCNTSPMPGRQAHKGAVAIMRRNLKAGGTVDVPDGRFFRDRQLSTIPAASVSGIPPHTQALAATHPDFKAVNGGTLSFLPCSLVVERY
jgi:hypothetical protein